MYNDQLLQRFRRVLTRVRDAQQTEHPPLCVCNGNIVEDLTVDPETTTEVAPLLYFYMHRCGISIPLSAFDVGANPDYERGVYLLKDDTGVVRRLRFLQTRSITVE